MKRLSIFIILLLFPVLVLAKNKMSMVTYFPVPYVAYSQVNADKQLDVGLTSTCDMNLGCNESNVNLKANQVNLTGGKLELNGGKGISGQTMTVGTGSGAGTISFTNIRIQGGNMESLNAGSMNVKELHLFGKKFPSCKDANGSGQMQWEALTLQGATKQELYLTCGDLGASVQCQPTDPRGATYTDPCPSGQTGMGAQYTWDWDSCSYKQTKSSTCSNGLKKYLSNYKCTGVNKMYMQGLGELNNPQDCDTVKSSGYNIWHLHNACVHNYLSDFEKIPTGCSPGKECSSCIPGKKYISGDCMFPGATCRQINMNAPERDRMLFVVQYVSCGEHATPYSPSADVSCLYWSDTGGGGEELLFPVIPSL